MSEARTHPIRAQHQLEDVPLARSSEAEELEVVLGHVGVNMDGDGFPRIRQRFERRQRNQEFVPDPLDVYDDPSGCAIPQDALESCYTEAQRADVVLLVGTSAVVYPAAEFPVIAHRRGAKLIEVNPQETPLSGLSTAVLRAPSGQTLPQLLARVRELAPDPR